MKTLDDFCKAMSAAIINNMRLTKAVNRYLAMESEQCRAHRVYARLEKYGP